MTDPFWQILLALWLITQIVGLATRNVFFLVAAFGFAAALLAVAVSNLG